jgi:hypothetical protein
MWRQLEVEEARIEQSANTSTIDRAATVKKMSCQRKGRHGIVVAFTIAAKNIPFSNASKG